MEAKISYSSTHDLFYASFNENKESYEHTIELNNVLFDVSKNNTYIGIEIINDCKKVLQMSQEELKDLNNKKANIKLEAQSITIEFHNKIVKKFQVPKLELFA